MEGRTQESRSIPNPSYIPDGNPGHYGGGTYTGQSNEPTNQDYENIFGPAGRDVKLDPNRSKRFSRAQLPQVLVGYNQYLTDRIDGLISDSTNSPFTTLILPYKYIENPDQKLTWASWSFDEGLASRVPYEAAARTLTQSKRSYKAYLVRHGLAITMEHNFMMSLKGRENFQNQLKQLVGSIQYSNDLDVHMALITAPSYAKTWAEKYSSSDKTDAQICREFVDLYGFLQKNPNGLDILIEEAKSILATWGSPPPTFMLCNQKLAFQMTMTPEKTSYITQGIDGIKRLRAGPDISSFRGLSIINTRAFSMEVGAPPRDILRRRVRVAEYYRVPPQGVNARWAIELYDESRDTWFTIRREELDRYARLDNYNNTHYNLPPDQIIVFREYLNNPNDCAANNNVELHWPTTPAWQTKLIKPAGQSLNFAIPSDWDATMTIINTQNNGIYANRQFRSHHYRAIIENLVNVPYLRPNNVLLPEPLPPVANNLQACAWLFTQAALLPRMLSLLWMPVPTISMELMTTTVLPFLFAGSGELNAAIQSYRATAQDINPYNAVMTLVLVATIHPNLDVQRQILETLRAARVEAASLRAVVARFVRACFHPRAGERPRNRIQLGRMLDEYVGQAFQHLLGPGLDQSLALYDPWPAERDVGNVSIMHYANVSETHHTLAHPAVEQAYDQHPEFHWNFLPPIPPTSSIANLDEDHAIAVFLQIVIKRMFRNTAALTSADLYPEFLPHLEVQDRGTEDYEYVLIRPCIEHNMLGIIIGRSGIDELGATLWGQTELSCYDDSFHGVFGMSYKYHERALVFNERNMIRLFDVAYDGYNGGKGDVCVDWAEEAPNRPRPFNRAVTDLSVPYQGPSIMVMRFRVDRTNPAYKTYWPSPIVFHDKFIGQEAPKVSPDPESIYLVQTEAMRIFNNDMYREQYRAYLARMADFSYFHHIKKPAGNAAIDMESTQNSLAFQGSFRIKNLDRPGVCEEILGSGHHGPDFVGAASLRAGKGIRAEQKAPSLCRMI